MTLASGKRDRKAGEGKGEGEGDKDRETERVSDSGRDGAERKEGKLEDKMYSPRSCPYNPLLSTKPMYISIISQKFHQIMNPSMDLSTDEVLIIITQLLFQIHTCEH